MVKKSEIRSKFFQMVSNGFGKNLIDKSIKRLKDGLHCGYIDVCILDSQKVVRKIYFSKRLYLKEKKFLITLSGYEHSPNIIKYDDEKCIIIMEYVGVSLAELYKSTKERRKYTKQIIKAKDLLEKKYGIFQNDLRWKNTCLLDGKIYFVDWARASKNNIEKDPEKIITT